MKCGSKSLVTVFDDEQIHRFPHVRNLLYLLGCRPVMRETDSPGTAVIFAFKGKH